MFCKKILKLGSFSKNKRSFFTTGTRHFKKHIFVWQKEPKKTCSMYKLMEKCFNAVDLFSQRVLQNGFSQRNFQQQRHQRLQNFTNGIGPKNSMPTDSVWFFRTDHPKGPNGNRWIEWIDFSQKIHPKSSVHTSAQLDVCWNFSSIRSSWWSAPRWTHDTCAIGSI